MPKRTSVSYLVWLPHTLPKRELGGQGIVHDFGHGVEVHDRPADDIILGPAAVAHSGESNPGRVHRRGERLRRGWPKKRPGSKTERIEQRTGSRPNGPRQGARRTAATARQIRTCRSRPVRLLHGHRPFARQGCANTIRSGSSRIGHQRWRLDGPFGRQSIRLVANHKHSRLPTGLLRSDGRLSRRILGRAAFPPCLIRPADRSLQPPPLGCGRWELHGSFHHRSWAPRGYN